jgi:hypothetical protein
MGSFAGAAPTPMLAIYSASKSFVRTWSEGLAAELASKGVIVEHVNTYYVVRLLPCIQKERKKKEKRKKKFNFFLAPFTYFTTHPHRLRQCRKSAARRCSSPPQKLLCAPCSRRSHRAPSRPIGLMRCSALPWDSRHPRWCWRTRTLC